MGDFRSLLIPKEGSRGLYLNQQCDLDLGVAMRFEKRVDVKRDRSLFGKRVDVGSDRRLAFIFSGSAAVAAGQSVRRPPGSGARGARAKFGGVFSLRERVLGPAATWGPCV